MEDKELNLICGQRLKECLKEKKMKQCELAEKVYVTQQYISNLIKGKRPMNPHIAYPISEVLDVSSEYLLGKSSKKSRYISPEEIHSRNRDYNNALLLLLSFHSIKILRQVITIKTGEVIYNYNARTFFSAFRTMDCEEMCINDNEYSTIEYDIEISEKVYRVPSHRINEIVSFITSFMEVKKNDLCNGIEKNEYKEIKYTENKNRKVPNTIGWFFE